MFDNKAYQREWQPKWRAANPDKIAEYNRRNRERKAARWRNDPAWRARIIADQKARRVTMTRADKDTKNAYMRKWYAASPTAKVSRQKRTAEYHNKLRAEALAAYGNKCSCCGLDDPEFLTIDHPNGRKACGHAKRLTGWGLYKWLRDHNYPQGGFRAQCWNCNCTRARLGYCPHERESK